jgi:hypothetical protein
MHVINYLHTPYLQNYSLEPIKLVIPSIFVSIEVDDSVHVLSFLEINLIEYKDDGVTMYEGLTC